MLNSATAFNITALEEDSWAMPDVNLDCTDPNRFLSNRPVKVRSMCIWLHLSVCIASDQEKIC
jgi:hypothetical protein